MPRYPQAILTSCEIPWDDNEELLEDVFRQEIRRTYEDFDHFYIFGTAGEGYAVDTRRFQQIIEVFRDETRDLGEEKHVQVGIIGLSTANVVERMGFAYDAGFRIFQISLPAWGELTDAELLTYFTDVCGTFPDAQFLHYNLPRARRVLAAEHYRPLIDAVPNFVATKNCTIDEAGTRALAKEASELQHFLGERNLSFGVAEGECSLLSSWAPMNGPKVKQFFDAAINQREDELAEFRAQYATMVEDLLLSLGGGVSRIDGAYDKMIVRLGGFEQMPLRLLSPYHYFTEEDFQTSKRILHERYPDWVPSA